MKSKTIINWNVISNDFLYGIAIIVVGICVALFGRSLLPVEEIPSDWLARWFLWFLCLFIGGLMLAGIISGLVYLYSMVLWLHNRWMKVEG